MLTHEVAQAHWRTAKMVSLGAHEAPVLTHETQAGSAAHAAVSSGQEGSTQS
jgi:hypothetical protein